MSISDDAREGEMDNPLEPRRCESCGTPLLPGEESMCVDCETYPGDLPWAVNTDHKTSLWDADEEDE